MYQGHCCGILIYHDHATNQIPFVRVHPLAFSNILQKHTKIMNTLT